MILYNFPPRTVPRSSNLNYSGPTIGVRFALPNSANDFVRYTRVRGGKHEERETSQLRTESFVRNCEVSLSSPYRYVLVNGTAADG